MKKIIIIILYFFIVVSLSICIATAQTYTAKTKDNEVSSVDMVVIEETKSLTQKRELSLRKIAKERAGLVAQADRLTAQIAMLDILAATITPEAEKVVLIDLNAEEIIK